MSAKPVWELDAFLAKHRELDEAHYGGTYDDCDKYTCLIEGTGKEVYEFLRELRFDRIQNYVHVDPALLRIHIQKASQCRTSYRASHPLTIYRVGTQFGQRQELKGWLEWVAQKQAAYPHLTFEWQFHHASQPEPFILYC